MIFEILLLIIICVGISFIAYHVIYAMKCQHRSREYVKNEMKINDEILVVSNRNAKGKIISINDDATCDVLIKVHKNQIYTLK